MGHLDRLIAILGTLVAGCSSPTSPSPEGTACNPSMATSQRSEPFFSRPFDGDAVPGNLFDHDKPLPFQDANGFLLTLCGTRDSGQVDGHDGYDWRMAEGRRILAVADGLVMFAGQEPPFFCPPLGRTVQALYVQLRHRAPGGEEFITVYGHLSRVDVAQGQQIGAATAVGLSGNTGCSGTPHLHFSTFRSRSDGTFAPIDPFGWHVSSPDPWESDSQGIGSVWLWRDGAAQPLR